METTTKIRNAAKIKSLLLLCCCMGEMWCNLTEMWPTTLLPYIPALSTNALQPFSRHYPSEAHVSDRSVIKAASSPVRSLCDFHLCQPVDVLCTEHFARPHCLLSISRSENMVPRVREDCFHVSWLRVKNTLPLSGSRHSVQVWVFHLELELLSSKPLQLRSQ